jgi:hypothetical protein
MGAGLTNFPAEEPLKAGLTGHLSIGYDLFFIFISLMTIFAEILPRFVQRN